MGSEPSRVDEDESAALRPAATSAGVGGEVEEEDGVRMVKPYCMSVMPSPARDPCFAAWVVCRRYVRRKPTNWKDIDISPFQRKEKMEPTGRPSMKTSSDP